MDLIEELTRDSERILEREIEEVHQLMDSVWTLLSDIAQHQREKSHSEEELQQIETRMEKHLVQIEEAKRQKIEQARERHRERIKALLEWARKR